ncbi:hypothetical protein KKG83_03975 [Candidatus Micrarchaeota archaeon]|nr:hypothetical protein [Candidatus Micrarchaeota archaeon]MBU2476603.1 hypothetical protein [Candidatus Micrarchaeota archaeon]
MKNKGYLGPIGDDLPSLIPLMFALIIFFSSFYMTIDTYNTKTVDFENDIAVVQVSATLRGTGLVSSLADFQKYCNALNVRQPYFSAGIVSLDQNFDFFDESFNLDVLYLSEEDSGNEGKFKCSNTEKILTKGIILQSNSKVVSRIYPLVLEQKVEGKSRMVPVKLVVIAWQE